MTIKFFESADRYGCLEEEEAEIAYTDVKDFRIQLWNLINPKLIARTHIRRDRKLRLFFVKDKDDYIDDYLDISFGDQTFFFVDPDRGKTLLKDEDLSQIQSSTSPTGLRVFVYRFGKGIGSALDLNLLLEFIGYPHPSNDVESVITRVKAFHCRYLTPNREEAWSLWGKFIASFPFSLVDEKIQELPPPFCEQLFKATIFLDQASVGRLEKTLDLEETIKVFRYACLQKVRVIEALSEEISNSALSLFLSSRDLVFAKATAPYFHSISETFEERSLKLKASTLERFEALENRRAECKGSQKDIKLLKFEAVKNVLENLLEQVMIVRDLEKVKIDLGATLTALRIESESLALALPDFH
ncbi:hypothetical protein HDU97_004743 [Phlyctochytrium planicorne]|nr:hypothetical protein HDU97_004743 [Phlyctochytrium planicorne]